MGPISGLTLMLMDQGLGAKDRSWLPACMCFSDSNFPIEIMEHMIGEGYLIQMSFYSFLNVNMS